MNSNTLKEYLRRIVRYISERILLRNIVLAFLIIIFGLLIVLGALKIYTRHGHDLSVPDFTGFTLEDAILYATERDLRIEVLDSVYLDDFERGTVVDQHPIPGFKVKKSRKIFLTMNAVNAEKVAMPDLVELTARQARARLESVGLNTGEITYEPDIGINIVLAQKINGVNVTPGDSIVKGLAIDLVLGKGLSDEETAVPKLVGLSLDEAKILASDMFLTIGAVVPDATLLTEEDEAVAQIFRQQPQPGRENMLPLGSSIDVWLTLDSVKIEESVQLIDSLLMME